MNAEENDEANWGVHVADHESIIKMLVWEIYTEAPEAAIREILQNAHDATVERGGEYYEPITIKIEQGSSRGRLVIIEDNGIGMTRDDLQKKLLAVAARSKADWEKGGSKSGRRFELKRKTEGTIGKYGIGFLAAFILADSVIVETRHIDAGPSEAWRLEVALNRKSPPTPTTLQKVGTRITLHIRDLNQDNEEFRRAALKFLDPENLVNSVRRLFYFF